MKRIGALTLMVTLISAQAYFKAPMSPTGGSRANDDVPAGEHSGRVTTLDNVLLADQTGRLVMTEKGDGTDSRPLGVDFDFTVSQTDETQE